MVDQFEEMRIVHSVLANTHTHRHRDRQTDIKTHTKTKSAQENRCRVSDEALQSTASKRGSERKKAKKIKKIQQQNHKKQIVTNNNYEQIATLHFAHAVRKFLCTLAPALC